MNTVCVNPICDNCNLNPSRFDVRWLHQNYTRHVCYFCFIMMNKARSDAFNQKIVTPPFLLK